MTDIAALGISVQSNDVVTATQRLDQLPAAAGRAESATNSLSSSFGGLAKYIQAAAAAFTLFKLAEYAKDTAMLAARVETLSVVMKVVGANAGYTSSQMDAFTSGLKKMGITTQESMSSLIKMAGANMDLAKSSQLARVAQDAAVIGGINSSEAFGRMIQGIRSGEVEILKTIGINVQFEQGYKKTAAALGKTTQELSNTEKTASRMNEVLAFGTNIAGAYEASMSTAGKQMLSMSRYTEELKLQIGQTFSPALTSAVGALVSSLKFLDKNFESISGAAKALAEVGLLVFFARLTETAATAVVAENNYMRSVAAGNVVTLGSAEASAQKAAAHAIETSNIVATTAAQEAYWKSELASAAAIKEKLVIEAQSLPIGVSRASNAERIAIANMEVRATEIMLAEATAASTTAQAANITATTALTIAQGEASLAGRVLTGVQGGLQAALALVGGELGLIVIAVMAAYYAWDKYAHAQEDAQKKINQFDNSSMVGQLVQQNKELEKSVKLLTQTASSKAAESESQFQVAMKNRYTDERVLVEKLATAKANANVYGIQQNTSEMKAIESKLFLVRRDLEYAPKLREENQKLLAQQEKAKATKNTSPAPAATSGGSADPYAQARYDEQIRNAEAALKNEYRQKEKIAEDAALKNRLAQLSYEKEMGLKTTQQYLDERYIVEKTAYEKELKQATEQAHLRYLAYAKTSDDPNADMGMQIKDEQEWVKALGDAQKIQEKLAELNAQKPRDDAKNNLDITKQYLSAEQALLSARGETYAATLKQIEVDQQSRLQMDEKTKAVYDQIDAIKKQKAAYDELNAVNAIKNQTEDIKISMISDPYERQRATMEAKYAREKELLEQQLSMSKQGSDTEAAQAAQLAALQIQYAEDVKNARVEESKAAWDTTMAYAKKAVPQFAALDKLIAASQKDFTVKGKDGVVDQTKSSLAMYSAFAGAATDIFSSLAEQQDQTSREGFEAAKNYSLAAAVMNTAAGIMNAFATSSNIYAGVAMAAVVAAAGVIQIAKISSTSYGGGGSVSVPSGTAAGAGANGGGVAGSAIGERYTSVQDSQTTESLQKLADSADNASLAIGKIADGFSKISDLFIEGSYGSLFAGNAYGINKQATSTGAAGVSTGNILSGFSGTGNFLFGLGNKFAYKSSTMMFGGTSGNVLAVDADEYHRKGGLLGGSATKYDIKYDAEWTKFLQGLVSTIGTSINRMAITMGTTANVAGVSLPGVVIQTSGRTSEQISKDVEKWLENVAANLAKTVPELEKYAFAGENYYLALTRLNDALVSTNQSFQLIGVTLIESSLKGANEAYKLQDLMGGSEKFTTKINDYFTGMYTDTQQAAIKAAQAATQVNNAFAEMGVAAPTTREQFIALVQSLDVSSEAGAKTFAALMDIASAFTTMTEQAEKVAKAQEELNQDVISRTYRVNDHANIADIYDLSKQQAKELADAQEQGLDVSGLLTIQALEMAKAIKEASETFSEAQQKLIDVARTSLEETISYQTAAANLIKSILTDSSNMSPEAAYRQAQTNFASSTAENTPEAVSALLKASRAYYGSGAGYQSDLQTALDKLGTVAGIGADPTLEAANKQIDKLEEIRKLLDANDTAALQAYQTNTELGILVTAFLTANQAAIAANLAALHELGIPGYATGTSYVPYDMTANIHQGEIIMDRASSDVLRRYGVPVSGSADNGTEIAELKAEIIELKRAIVSKLTDIESPLKRVASR